MPCNSESEHYVIPYTILVDSNETQPFTFQGLTADSDHEYRPISVHTQWQSLGRYPNSLGDYAIKELIGRCHVERKSMEDCQGTVLGWESKKDRESNHAGRRQRFESELENLTKIESAAVVVECSLQELIRTVPSYGKRTSKQNAKSLYRSILSYIQDYGVPWLFCDSRRLAEITTFRWFDRFYRHHREELADGAETALDAI